MTVKETNDEFKGLKLPKSVARKIYRLNAKKWYPDIL